MYAVTYDGLLARILCYCVSISLFTGCLDQHHGEAVSLRFYTSMDSPGGEWSARLFSSNRPSALAGNAIIEIYRVDSESDALVAAIPLEVLADEHLRINWHDDSQIVVSGKNYSEKVIYDDISKSWRTLGGDAYSP